MLKNLKEPGSAITHFIGMLMAAFSAIPLFLKLGKDASTVHIVSFMIFIVSMVLLYAASTLHHSLKLSEKGNRIFRKIDHMMIFVLIAGTYTPVCLIVLEPSTGIPLLAVVWSIAIVGILIKALWITCPKWFSSVLYIAMGWVCVIAFTQLLNNLSSAAFGWLLAGGIVYTIGGIIYALKLPIFNARHKNFGSHEIFHLFVMAGSFCHFILMYSFLSIM
ncbi:MAG: hemolysin III family protein [Lachnospiraceae bacterium]|nr:hemolysin III family protein [Lachnospiraceae bacterium]